LEIPTEDLHETHVCQMHRLLALGLGKQVASESHCCKGLDWPGVSVEALQNNRSKDLVPVDLVSPDKPLAMKPGSAAKMLPTVFINIYSPHAEFPIQGSLSLDTFHTKKNYLG